MSERRLQIQKAAVTHVAAVWAQGNVFKLTSQRSHMLGCGRL